MSAQAITLNNSPLRRFANALYRRPNLYLALLLAPPLLWFGAIYLGSLLALMWQGFYTFDDFTMSVLPEWTLDNYRQLLNASNLDIVVRTVSMALAVSLADALMAFPIALYMALYASAPDTSPGTHIRQLRSKRRRSGIHRHGNREALMCSDILASITGRQGSGLGQRGGRHLGHQRLLRLFCGRLAACGSQRIPGIGLLPIRSHTPPIFIEITQHILSIPHALFGG